MELHWTVFAGVDVENKKIDGFKTIPDEIDGVSGKKVIFSGGVWSSDISPEIPEKALFFCEFDSDSDNVLPCGFGACYFFQVFLNGKLLLDRREFGNKPYSMPPAPENYITPAAVKKGKNLLAVAVESKSDEPLRFAFRIMDSVSGAKIVPSLENFRDLINRESMPAENSPERKMICTMIQNGVLMMRNTIFNPYSEGEITDPAKIDELQRSFPILYYYEHALDKIIRELKSTFPGEDEVVIWHLYNMGYVIKTAEAVFGIDINHRRAAELEPFLDFVLTTHNHLDHYSMGLFNRMTANQKKVVSNFHAAPGFHRPPAEIELNGIRITTQENDHNPTLKKFVTEYLIRLPNGCTLYCTGDSRNAEQLNPTVPVDIFIPHPRVGLSVVEAVKKFHPRSVLYSHMLEMRHTPPCPWYAVPYNLLDEERQTVYGLGTTALAPIWGEKLLWKTEKASFV